MENLQDYILLRKEINWSFLESKSPEERLSLLKGVIDKTSTNKIAFGLQFKDDSFSTRVFELITKAQSTPENYFRLMIAFPDYVKLWEEWQSTKDEKYFFKKYGII